MAEIDFEAEGLLEGVEGEARRARRELLVELAAEGFGLDELRRAVAEDRLVLLPVERELGGAGLYTAGELAELAGIDPGVLVRQQRALGLPVAEVDERVHGDEDLEAARRMKTFLDAGLPEEEMLEVARAIGIGMSQIAAANRALIGDSYLEEGLTERELGQRYAVAARELTPVVGRVMEHALRMHLREQIRHDAVGRAEITAGRLPGASEVAITFADLVDFTRLGERLTPEEVGSMAGRLGEIASEVVAPPVRLVKMIGDAAMIAGSDPRGVVEAALALVERAAADEALPPLRAGVAIGQALGRGGDYYGRPVNLAARLTSAARPESVLVTGELKEAAGEEGLRYSFAGQRRFKGVRGELAVYRVRRANGGGA